MDKIVQLTESLVMPDRGPIPKPTTEIANYDPEVEPPLWNWSRLRWGLTKQEPHPDKPPRGGQALSDDKPDWRGVIKNNVIPMEPEKAYDFGQPEYRGYYFFDTPDYADPFKKLWYSFKFFFKTGGIVSCSVAIMQNKEFNWPTLRHLWRNWYCPWLVGGMVASATVVTVANLRNRKDDQWNYVAAGLIAACATGRRNWIHHMNHSVYWVMGATVIKYANETNMVLYPTMNLGIKSLGSLQGNSAENGITSGNLHFIKSSHGDPGRDTRRHAL